MRSQQKTALARDEARPRGTTLIPVYPRDGGEPLVLGNGERPEQASGRLGRCSPVGSGVNFSRGLAGQALSLWPFPPWTLRVRPTLSVIAFGRILSIA
ncbi:MAG TPA: hypothetical protein VJ183_02000 [Chloroflexia bacterium]|nr:hypothetical protein [Chloroflexia bacterium]